MFPLTHLYFYSTMFPVDPSGAVGAVFPDTILLLGFRWNKTHKETVPFYEGLDKEDKVRFRSFFRGWLSHSVDSEGLDYYGDEKYLDNDRGYAYAKAGPIIDKVVKACRIPPELGLWKAHNFVEMAIESLVAKKEPTLRQWVNRMRKAEGEVDAISELLAGNFPAEKEKIKYAIFSFIDFMKPSGDPLELGQSYARVLNIRHQISDADPVEIAGVIEDAKALISDDYLGFIEYCRGQFEKRWPEFFDSTGLPSP